MIGVLGGRWVTGAVGLVAALAQLACGSTAQPAPAWHLLAVKLPAAIAGFDVKPEQASASSLEKAGGPNSLIDGAAVFSLHQAGQVDAVVEVSEFKPGANPADPGFQRDITGQIGQSVPRAVKVTGQTVYESTAPNQQSIYSWFTGRHMVVLLVHGIKDPELLLEALLRQKL